MIIDCHVHMSPGAQDKDALIKHLDVAGVEQAVLFSYHPASFYKEGTVDGEIFGEPMAPAGCLAQLMDMAAFSKRIIPFFWIDPLDGDAFDQVDKAVAAGVAGFKVICNRFFPGDGRAMQVWERIAKANKPILFHSGILYGSGPWSQYNRPVGFEPLLDIPGLRFALAHVSWPWYDECLAVYGFAQNRKRRSTSSAEMFIDTTKGSPPIYRRDIISKIYTLPYDIENNVMFGTDCSSNYNTGKAEEKLSLDYDALDFAEVSAERREKYFRTNALRFING